jgi:outer membrane receptor protein involved in Fe transport
MKFKILPFLAVLCFLVVIGSAQNPYAGGKRPQKGPSIIGHINGHLIDSITNEAIEFASVALLNAEQKIINGAITDESGKFHIEKVKTGKYALEFSFLGYETKKVFNIELTLKKPDLDVGNIFLATDSQILDEIEVVEEASLIENKIDRIVYNAEKDISTNGDAADVLRKVPMLSVDLEGNVEMRGSQNINILINGRPSGMFSSSVADALKMIPAEQIKSVEVITSPSAKYDGEGTAGIINIITRKKSAEGTSGSINLTAGNRNNRAVGNLSMSRGRLGVNFSGSAIYSNPQEGTNTFFRRDDFENESRIFERNGTNVSSRIGFNGNASLFYDLNAFNSISSSFQLRGFNFDRDGSLASSFNDPAKELNQIYTRSNDGLTGRSGYEWTTDYTKKFSQANRELSLAVQINGNNSDNDIIYKQVSDDPSLEEEEITFNKGRNVETTLQADYTHPFSSKVTLEVGGKSVLREIESDYRFERLNNSSSVFEIDPQQTDIFNYDQDVYAGYGSFRINFNKSLGLVAGARYEYTDIKGDFRDFESPFSNNYSNVLPSIILSKKVKKFNTLKLSYNQRIQRPSLRYINPFVNNEDDRNISFGNPELEPEISHQYEVGYTTFSKGNVVNASFYYRRTKDVIESILEVSDAGVSITSFSNLGTRNSFGMNLFGSYKVKKALVLRGGIDIYSFDIKGTFNGVELANTGINYSARIIGTLNLPKEWKVETFGLLNSPRITVQGKLPSFSMLNLGVRKDIWQKKGSIGLTITSPFSEDIAFKTELEGDDFFQSNEFTRPFRSIGINFRYRFGKLEFKQRRSKIRNDDMKQGGDAEGNQMQGK